MLNGYNRCHTVPDISARKVIILLLKDSKLSGIVINNGGKDTLKTGNMCTTFRVINIITKAQNCFVEFINILECHFNLYTFCLTFKIDNRRYRLIILVNILNKAFDSVRLMKFYMLCFITPLILINNGKLGIKVCSLVHS